jgi:hypothetical protein
MKLEDITPGARLTGITGDEPVNSWNVSAPQHHR